ncbi:uncharacterized protein [Miscanthus floridulus]|uniref:uncharacterized protein isoform X3 n=1 Tax=Miscanthus floridulus TaxID=154761 RepID=UPI0034592512
MNTSNSSELRGYPSMCGCLTVLSFLSAQIHGAGVVQLQPAVWLLGVQRTHSFGFSVLLCSYEVLNLRGVDALQLRLNVYVYMRREERYKVVTQVFLVLLLTHKGYGDLHMKGQISGARGDADKDQLNTTIDDNEEENFALFVGLQERVQLLL